MLMLNLLLEIAALGFAWCGKPREKPLLLFLLYLVLFDVGLSTAGQLHGTTPFYAYWAGRSAGALLLMFLAGGLWYRPCAGAAAAVFLPAYWMGRVATTALGALVLALLWARGLRSNAQAAEAMQTVALIILFQFAVAAFSNPRKRILALSCALWPLATLVFDLPVYPAASLAPLSALCLYSFIQNCKERRIVTRHGTGTGRTFRGSTTVQISTLPAAAARNVQSTGQWRAAGGA